MSFILDALKKSESERNRQSGPVLMDVRIAPPRRRLPVWAWVIGVVLAGNLGVLGFLLWHAPAKPEPARPSSAPAAPAVTTAAPPVAPAAPVIPPAAVPLPEPAESAPAPVSPDDEPAVVAASPPPAPAPAAVDIADLPSAQDLQATGFGLPELRMNWHVYDPNAAKRYVLLNSSRLHEGESTPEGVKVIAITAAGAALEWHGRRFFMNAGG